MNNYIARILVEHRITPTPTDYASFSEVIILGQYPLPEDMTYSSLLYDERTDIIEDILQDIGVDVNDIYENANQEMVSIIVRDIVKIEETDLQIPPQKRLYEVDERLYTFNRPMSYEAFKQSYLMGMDVE